MSPARTAAARAAVGTALVAAATATGAYSLTEVVYPGRWVPVVVWSVVAVALVVAATRWWVLTRAPSGREGGLLALPTAAGAVVSLVLWIWLGLSTDPAAAAQPGGRLGNTLTELGRLHQLVNDSVAPVDGTAPVVVATLGAALLLLLVGDALAVPLRAPVAAAAPALVLWLPALVLEARVPTVTVVVTVVSLLCLLAAEPGGAAPGRGRVPRGVTTLSGASGVLAGAAAVTVVALVVGGAASALPGAGGKPLRDLFSSGVTTGRIGDDLNVLADLGQRSGDVVMTLRTTQGADDPLGPLRLLTLTTFDGKTWQPDRVGSDSTDVTPGDVLWPTPVGDSSPSTVVQVTPALLPERRLAVPTEPRAVRTDGRVRYDPVRDEVYRTTGGSTSPYRVEVHPRDLTAATLGSQRAGFTDDSPVTDAVRRDTLAIPSSSHERDVAALAQQLTRSASSDYDKVMALQSYFRDASVFTYSTRAPRDVTGDAVWDFLTARSGFCVQYATAMAVMLRTLGIPARVGVGYLTHPPDTAGVSQVTGRDAHAWPEVYFQSSGWVRFEPTPAVQSGAAPAWADPLSLAPGSSQPDVAPELQNQPPPSTSTTAPEDAGTTTSQAPGVQRSNESWSPTRIAILVLLAIAVLGLAAGAWWRARRLRRRVVVDAEDAWELLRTRLEGHGVTWPESTTPRNVPYAVADAVSERTDGGLPESASRSLAELCALVQDARYARSTSAPATPVELANLVDDVVAGVGEALTAHSGTRAH